MKPKLRLLTEDIVEPPAPLRFPGASTARSSVPKATTSHEAVAGVEAAMQDAQRRLDKLRELVFPVNPNDNGPRAA